MYDDWFKMTKGEDTIATIQDFTPAEQKHVWGIKQAITDPSEAKEKEDNYHKNMSERRSLLATLFEFPEPVDVKDPVTETGTTDYEG